MTTRLFLTLCLLLISSTCCSCAYDLSFAFTNNTLSFKPGKVITMENIKEGDVLSYGYYFSFLFVRKETLDQFDIRSFKQFIQTNPSMNKTIGVDSNMVSVWLAVLEFYGVESNNWQQEWETFEFYSTFCAPNNPFKKYDIMFTFNNVFFNAHFYDSSTHLLNFIPVRVFPYSFRMNELYPFLLKYASSPDQQYDRMNTNLYMYLSYGNVSEEDVSFLKFYTGIDNITIDYNNFKLMIENAGTFFGIDLFNITPTIRDYLRNVNIRQLEPLVIDEDYWGIPVLALIILYFLLLFASRLFLKPAMKIRLLTPYFPIFLIIQEFGNTNYFFFYCFEWVGYLRMLIFCFVCLCYGFTVVRIYYLRNIYSLMYKNEILDETSINRMKLLTTKKFALLAIPGMSLVLSLLFTLQGLALLFPIGSTTRYHITNFSFPIYPIIGGLFSVFAVTVDIKMNWKQIKEKGLRKFLLFDDPFNVRIDLILMGLLLIIVITIVILNGVGVDGHGNHFVNCFAYLVFILICGGNTIIKELIIAIKKDRSPKSELESLLENNSFRELFKEYSTKEMSLENYMFYEKLRDLVSKYGMNGFIPSETLQEIETLFFSQESPYELNIPSKTRKLFYTLFEKSSVESSSSAELLETGLSTKVSDLYTIIYNDLYTNMSDTHSRFIETEEFKKWYSVFTIQRKQSLIIVK